MMQGMNRRHFLYAALSGVALNACSQPPRPPNIVFVMLDDLGYADFGSYGQKLIRTPRADAFAREGMRFTHAYAGSTVCAPSRCVLMTGKHTGHASVRTNAGTMPLRPEDVTVASMLREAGYATGAFGKWGLGDIRTTGVPWKHGFDEFYGYLHQVHAHSYYPDFLWDNETQVRLTDNEGGKGEATYGGPDRQPDAGFRTPPQRPAVFLLRVLDAAARTLRNAFHSTLRGGAVDGGGKDLRGDGDAGG